MRFDQEYRVGYKSESTGLHFELQVNARLSTVRNGIRDFILSPSTKKFLVCTSITHSLNPINHSSTCSKC